MPTNTAVARHPLVSQLADRIGGPLDLEEPYIVQDRVPQTQSRHAVVIWDAWAGIDRSERGRVIAEAFRDAGVQDALRVAVGLTQQDALGMGYLPFQIAVNWKKTDGESILKSLKAAIQQTPGVHVRTGSSVQLRYPTLEYAQEAYRRLSAAVPGPYWTIIKEEGTAE